MADEYISREAAIALYEGDETNSDKYHVPVPVIIQNLKDIPAADVVARDCFNKILAENDDMRAIIDTYGGLENIQSAFVKLHEIENADVRPVVRCKDCKYSAEARENDKGFLICVASGMDITDYDYCSYGERMDMVTDSNQVKDGDGDGV